MIKSEDFGTFEGNKVIRYTVYGEGIEFSVINYGAALTSLKVPDARGKFTDVLLGYDSLDEYASNGGYLGASIGRVANRIAGARFSYCGTEYKLYANDGNNTLHGGLKGFDKKVWKSAAVGNSVIMSCVSEDGEEGFFGRLDTEVEFFLDEDRGLHIVYTAVTDSESAVNLTNHAYFNLNGEGSCTVLDHSMRINSSCITAIDKNLVPNGVFKEVAGTPFDFTSAKAIGRDLSADDEQLAFAGGYDHNFVLDNDFVSPVAVTSGDKSGIVMETFTNQNGLQFYGGNFLDGVKGKGGKPYNKRCAFCLEAQSFPNALNVPAFGIPVIRAGETYRNEIVYRFSVKGQ
ncbi:MAG: galactose mutarotase [Clostridia bacterium]|nr:galactose mutarotase [Clostridia bacterium]